MFLAVDSPLLTIRDVFHILNVLTGCWFGYLNPCARFQNVIDSKIKNSGEKSLQGY